jgi:hypothetical protein
MVDQGFQTRVIRVSKHGLGNPLGCNGVLAIPELYREYFYNFLIIGELRGFAPAGTSPLEYQLE